MECASTVVSSCDSSNEDVIKFIPSSETQFNNEESEIPSNLVKVSRLNKELSDLQELNKQQCIIECEQKDVLSAAAFKLQDICSQIITDHNKISSNVVDANQSDIEKPDDKQSDKKISIDSDLISVPDKNISEEDSEIVKQSEECPEIGLSTSVPIDTDENTTQLRFDLCELPNEKSGQGQHNELQVKSTKTAIINASDCSSNCDILDEASYFLSHNETLKADLPQSYSSSHANQEENENPFNSNCIFTDSEPLPSVVEESSLDSGIVSLDDPEQSSSTTSSDNDTISILAPDGRTTWSSRKRPHAYILKSSSKRLKQETKKSVTFEGVTIYYFPRKQSFVTVPSQGGSTLGMGLHHTHSKHLTLDQHKRVVACHRRQVMKEHERQQRVKEKLKQLKQSHPDLGSDELMMMVSETNLEEDSSDSSSDEDYDEEKDLSDDDNEEEDDDDDDDDYFFLQPIPTKKRRLLLRIAGVKRIDAEEKLANKLTRQSREICGCDCEGTCLPEYCQCALAGIPCQVDRESFPCGCVVSGCHNGSGRVEFDADRVTSHYFQTMRRIRLEEMGSSHVLPFPNALKSPRTSPYVSATAEQNMANVTLSNALDPDTFTQASAEFQHCLQQGTQGETELSPVSASTPEPFDSWPACESDSSSPPTTRDDIDGPLDGSYIETFETVQGVQDRMLADDSHLDSSLIVSEQNGLDYLVPQPVSSATSSPGKAYLNNSCSDFGSSFSAPTGSLDPDFSVSMFSSGGLNSNFKQTYKLDPIASFLPPNSIASPKRAVQDPLNFASPSIEAIGQAASPSVPDRDGCSAQSQLL